MQSRAEPLAVALAAALTMGCTPICSFDEYTCYVENMAVYDRDGQELESYVVDSDVVVKGLSAAGGPTAGTGPKLTSVPTGPFVFTEDDPVVKLRMRYENPLAGGAASSGTNAEPLAAPGGGVIVGWGCFGIPHGSTPRQLPVSRALATLYSSPEETDSEAPEPDDEEGELDIQIEFDFDLYLDEHTFELDLIPFALTEGGDDVEAAVQDAGNLVLGPVTTIPMTRLAIDGGDGSGSATSGGSSNGGGPGEFCASQSDCTAGLVCSSGTACLYSSISGTCDCVELGQQCVEIPGLESCVPAGGETESNACCPGSILVNAVCMAGCP